MLHQPLHIHIPFRVVLGAIAGGFDGGARERVGEFGDLGGFVAGGVEFHGGFADRDAAFHQVDVVFQARILGEVYGPVRHTFRQLVGGFESPVRIVVFFGGAERVVDYLAALGEVVEVFDHHGVGADGALVEEVGGGDGGFTGADGGELLGGVYFSESLEFGGGVGGEFSFGGDGGGGVVVGGGGGEAEVGGFDVGVFGGWAGLESGRGVEMAFGSGGIAEGGGCREGSFGDGGGEDAS